MLSHLSIRSFHGIEEILIPLGRRTYVMGSNGSGKTHILDALHLISGAVPLYGDVRLDTGASIEIVSIESELEKRYRLSHDGKRDFFSIQNAKTTKPKYLSVLPWRTVYISPFDMNLLYFAPSMRRDYIDLILARTFSQFSRVKKDYELTMRQRNALLKRVRDGEARREDLDFWDAKFAELADTYGMYRERYRDFIVHSLTRFPDFFSKYPIKFVYESSWIDAEDRRTFITDYLLTNRERDILTGHTHIGPHRDDWGFHIVKSESGTEDNKVQESIPAEDFLSRGEMKMLLLGLKILEADFIEKTLHIQVVLLIDDIFAELDTKNSEIFLNSLMPYQMILTSQKPLPNGEKYGDFICINMDNL